MKVKTKQNLFFPTLFQKSSTCSTSISRHTRIFSSVLQLRLHLFHILPHILLEYPLVYLNEALQIAYNTVERIDYSIISGL